MHSYVLAQYTDSDIEHVYCMVLIGQSNVPHPTNVMHYMALPLCPACYVTICSTYSSYCLFSMHTNLLFVCCSTSDVCVHSTLAQAQTKQSIMITVECTNNINV